MIEYHKLYLPKSKREVKIEVSIPRDYEKLNTCFDTLYLLDGQNAFKDSHASFKRSIRASKHMGTIANAIGKRMIGVAIYNPETEMGRINEYAPFKIINPAEEIWEDQDVKVCHRFCDDLVHVIIPFIEKKYPAICCAENRFIYGSSLAALTALYLGYQYPNTFGVIGSFSTASFLCEKALTDFIKKKHKKNIRVFFYVGREESSDNLYNSELYYQSSLALHQLCTNLQIPVRLVISNSGTHCEACWEKQLLDFFSFIYYDSIILKN